MRSNHQIFEVIYNASNIARYLHFEDRLNFLGCLQFWSTLAPTPAQTQAGAVAKVASKTDYSAYNPPEHQYNPPEHHITILNINYNPPEQHITHLNFSSTMEI